MGQDHTEFTRALRNIKSRDIQSVAARMCRVIHDFPTNFQPRKIDAGGTEIDVSGYRYDSVWNECVGQALACVTGMDRTLAARSLEIMYQLSSFIVKHGQEILHQDYSKLTDDYNALVAAYNEVKTVNVVLEQSTLTYAQIGFFLDQSTIEERVRDVTTTKSEDDVYDFCKKLAFTDIIGTLRLIHGFTDAGEFKQDLPPQQKTYVEMIQTIAQRIQFLVTMMEEMVMDMAHQVDDLAACTFEAPAEDAITDVEHFNPETDTMHYDLVPVTGTPEGEGWYFYFSVEKGGINKRRVAVKTQFPFRVTDIKIAKAKTDFAVANFTEGTTGGATYVTRDLEMDNNTEVYVYVGRINTTSSDLSKIKVFINKAKGE